MTDFYIPKAGSITLASGRPFKFHRGIQAVPDEVANSPAANDIGIKPTSEMTDAEWTSVGLKKPVAAPKAPAPAPAPAAVPVPAQPAVKTA